MRYAISFPLSLMRIAHSCWPHLLTLATHGNIQTICDLQVSLYPSSPFPASLPSPGPLSSPLPHSLPPSLSLLPSSPPPSLPLSLSLPQVAARTLDAGIHGAYSNILTNLPHITTDTSYVTSVREEAERLARDSADQCSSVLDSIQQRLNSSS